ncbi:alpha/beta hydrolase family protein [Hyphobacterium sp.]|uniref:alpha/beta hydrolase family protein n=1 Tax=Hyphobacterium sp. TaxID=2004662 RepID=UPI003BAD3172
MRFSLPGTATLIASSALLAACSGEPEPLNPDMVCHVGTYQFVDGNIIDLGALSSDALRWRTMNGETGRIAPGENGQWSGHIGWSERPHPAVFEIAECGSNTITVSNIDRHEGEATRLAFSVEDTIFENEDEFIAGRLVTPQGEGPFPLVVLVHGSEDYSALDFYPMQRMLPAMGIAVFVYDKRGTGTSGGEYTQDFYLLASDAAAAMATARSLGGDRIGEAGYAGFSQGGWVGPLAASTSDPDFVIAAFGMAEGALAEDREEVLFNLAEAGYSDDPEVLAAGRELAEAVGRVMASDFEEGVEELAALKNQYQDEPWYDGIRGEFTHEFLARPIWQVEMAMPFFEAGTSWEYEPRPTLESLTMPSLWVLGGDDSSAPSANTQVILSELQADGVPIDVALFPTADHGIIEYEPGEDGERVSLRYSEGYYALLADWIRTRQFQGEYGTAQLTPRRQ